MTQAPRLNRPLRKLQGMSLSGLAAIAAAFGCHRGTPEVAPEAKLVVPVSTPVTRRITDYVYYTGRIDARESVDVRARVTGYLDKVAFKEGAEVKKGDVLFVVDPRPYQAQLDADKAQLELDEASYRLAKSENARSKGIARTSGAISAESLETSASQEAQGYAKVNLSKAHYDLSKLDLGFTQVVSPIDGHISRYLYTVGNLITQDQTVLTTVVSVEPMYLFFDMDERTILTIRKMINAGKMAAPKETTDLAVNMGLEGEAGFPHHGKLNFINNVINLSTGTITVRGEFANPKPEGGRRLLTPGMFVRVQLPVGQAHPALLVTERALGSDQGSKFLYVVDAEHKVQYRKVKAGAQQDDGLIAIDEGVKADDLVVVGSLPQIRPRMTVETETVTMPTLESSGDEAAPAAKVKEKEPEKEKAAAKDAEPAKKTDQPPPADKAKK